MVLPLPKDNPGIEINVTQEAFDDLDAPEDEALLDTGDWDGEPDDDETDNEGGDIG